MHSRTHTWGPVLGAWIKLAGFVRRARSALEQVKSLISYIYDMDNERFEVLFLKKKKEGEPVFWQSVQYYTSQIINTPT